MRSAERGAQSSVEERELRKFSVHGTGAVQLASIEKVAGRLKPSEIERRQRRDVLAQRLEIQFLLDARQREVWRKRPFLGGDAKRNGGAVHIDGQRIEARRFHAAPEDAGRMRIRKET